MDIIMCYNQLDVGRLRRVQACHHLLLPEMCVLKGFFHVSLQNWQKILPVILCAVLLTGLPKDSWRSLLQRMLLQKPTVVSLQMSSFLEKEDLLLPNFHPPVFTLSLFKLPGEHVWKMWHLDQPFLKLILKRISFHFAIIMKLKLLLISCWLRFFK